MNSVPFPISLETSIRPSIDWINDLARHSPYPQPCPFILVVKKISNIFGRLSSDIPGPVSAIDISIHPFLSFRLDVLLRRA